MNEYCNDCRYFKPTREAGICRRYPPTITGNPFNGIRTVMPEVLPAGWCGEFKGKL